MAKRITSTGLSRVSLPEMPAMPKLAAPPVKMAGAVVLIVSFNAGGGAPSSGRAQRRSRSLLRLSRGRGRRSVTGHFYDLNSWGGRQTIQA